MAAHEEAVDAVLHEDEAVSVTVEDVEARAAVSEVVVEAAAASQEVAAVVDSHEVVVVEDAVVEATREAAKHLLGSLSRVSSSVLPRETLSTSGTRPECYDITR